MSSNRLLVTTCSGVTYKIYGVFDNAPLRTYRVLDSDQKWRDWTPPFASGRNYRALMKALIWQDMESFDIELKREHKNFNEEARQKLEEAVRQAYWANPEVCEV